MLPYTALLVCNTSLPSARNINHEPAHASDALSACLSLLSAFDDEPSPHRHIYRANFPRPEFLQSNNDVQPRTEGRRRRRRKGKQKLWPQQHIRATPEISPFWAFLGGWGPESQSGHSMSGLMCSNLIRSNVLATWFSPPRDTEASHSSVVVSPPTLSLSTCTLNGIREHHIRRTKVLIRHYCVWLLREEISRALRIVSGL